MSGKPTLLLGILWVVAITDVAGQGSTGACRVTGTISGYKANTDSQVRVEAIVMGKPVSFDATPKPSGAFEVSINQPAPTAYNISIPGRAGSEPVMFFCDHGTVDIQLHPDKPASNRVKGGKSQTELEQYTSITKVPDDRMKTLAELWEAWGATGRLSGREDSLRELYSAAATKRENGVRQWLAGNRDSYVAPFVIALNYLSNGTAEVLEPMYAPLTQRIKDSYYGVAVGDKVNQLMATAIGRAAPDFSQADADGKPISLESLRGKFVLVDFWASWCGPCRQENPNLVKTYERFRDKLVILGVSLDQKRDPWLKAIQDDRLTWLHVSDLKGWGNAVAVQYGVNSIPANYLLDPTGKIVAKGLRGPELEARLAELIR